MDVNTIQANSPEDFLNSFFNSSQSTNSQQQEPQGTAAPIATQKAPEADDAQKKAEDEVAALLGEKKDEDKDGTTDTQTSAPKTKDEFFKSPVEFADKLLEEKLIYSYEDGSKPQTTTELLDALKQSSLYNAQQDLQRLWQEKVEKYSPAMQTIIQYADNGITTAEELTQFVNQVSHYEKVAALDPKKDSDQEHIVYMQMINNGFDDKGARDEIADLKTRGQLGARAEKYHPLLMNAYKGQVEKTYMEKQHQIEQEQQYVENNRTNVSWFLENEEQYLPFRVSRKDKANTFELAARPVDYTPDGEAVYGWQRYIESLQHGGDERSFKEYMRIMTFIANSRSYEDNLRKSGGNAKQTEQFKKISTGGKSNELTRNEPDTPVIRKPNNGVWSTKV